VSPKSEGEQLEILRELEPGVVAFRLTGAASGVRVVITKQPLQCDQMLPESLGGQPMLSGVVTQPHPIVPGDPGRVDEGVDRQVAVSAAASCHMSEP